MTASWKQDTLDYSWTLVDAYGCFYRAARAHDGTGQVAWVTAWTETNGLRIGSLWKTADEAKAAIERIADLDEAEAAAGATRALAGRGVK